MYHLDEIKVKKENGGNTLTKNNYTYTKADKNVKRRAKLVNSMLVYAKRGKQAMKPIVYGNREAYNERVKQIYPEINQTVDSIANAYNINPALINNRLLYEGFIDKVARQHDNSIKSIKTGHFTYPEHYYDLFRSGFSTFGTDDAATYIKSGKAKLINEPWEEETATNENGRVVHSVNTDWKSNIGILASMLKMFRDNAKNDFPGLSEDRYDELSLAYFNRGDAGGKRYHLSGEKDNRYSLRNIK